MRVGFGAGKGGGWLRDGGAAIAGRSQISEISFEGFGDCSMPMLTDPTVNGKPPNNSWLPSNPEGPKFCQPLDGAEWSQLSDWPGGVTLPGPEGPNCSQSSEFLP